MKFLLTASIIFLINIPITFGNKVTILVDYTMTKNRIDAIKKDYTYLFNENTDLEIFYLGKGLINPKFNKYEDFKTSCGFDECKEITNFLDNSDFIFKCFLKKFPKCINVQEDYSIPIWEPGSKLKNKADKKSLRKSKNTLLIDLKGGSYNILPELSISTSESEIEAGQEIILNAQLTNTNISNSGILEWFTNDIKVENRKLKYTTTLDENTIFKCTWKFENCIIESNKIEIFVRKCEAPIPYFLYFDEPLIYGKKKENPNTVYIYPLNSSNAPKIILLKQSCYFKEFELQILNTNGIILKTKTFQIDEYRSRELLKLLNIIDENIKAIDIQTIIDPFKEQVLYLKVIPTKINMSERNIPKYEVFFTSCSPHPN
jgi:hypothetical protein